MKEKIQKKYRLNRMSNSDYELNENNTESNFNNSNPDPTTNEHLQELANMEPISEENLSTWNPHSHRHHINDSRHRHRIFKHPQNNTYVNKNGNTVYKTSKGKYVTLTGKYSPTKRVHTSKKHGHSKKYGRRSRKTRRSR